MQINQNWHFKISEKLRLLLFFRLHKTSNVASCVFARLDYFSVQFPIGRNKSNWFKASRSLTNEIVSSMCLLWGLHCGLETGSRQIIRSVLLHNSKMRVDEFISLSLQFDIVCLPSTESPNSNFHLVWNKKYLSLVEHS